MNGRFTAKGPDPPVSSSLKSQNNQLPRMAELGGRLPVMRLGLATRGNTHLSADDVAFAVDRGVNYLNWCGYNDGIAQALHNRQIERERVVIAMQLDARDASLAARELENSCRKLGTDRIDVVTFYYVERKSEWNRIAAPDGALRALEEARADGRVELVGLTTHQRKLAAECALEGRLDLLMVRYNAAHRGAEQDVFRVAAELQMPVVVYTAQRWGALSRPTRDDPRDFAPPAPTEWYRFALAHPAVSVVLMAPNGRQELEEDLRLLDDWRAPTAADFEAMAAHGLRVRRHAGSFP